MFSTGIANSKFLNRIIFYAQRGFKKRETLASFRKKKKTNTERALEHFDDFYGKVFGERWASIRCALMSRRKFCAVVNHYGDTKETITALQTAGAINFKSFFSVENERLKVKESKACKFETGKDIYKLDQTVQQYMLSQHEKALEEVYPPREGAPFSPEDPTTYSADKLSTKRKEVAKLQTEPLHSSKKLANLDEQRMIDPAQRVSSVSLYEYVPATKLKGMEDWIFESQHYNYYKNTEAFPVVIEGDDNFDIPEHLHVFAYERGNISEFQSPKRGITNVLNYYLMDGSSVLPVLALDLKSGDSVLDMCAAPGGKSLLMLQTLCPSFLVCNDLTRVKRIKNVLHEYLYDYQNLEHQIKVTNIDGREFTNDMGFNKVLVDVPCTTDRHSLSENDNNIFNPLRVKERLCLPELQTDLLVNALKVVVPGGIVVYSTCTLSPIQNDGVVHMALRKVWQETNIEVEVRDLTDALKKTKPIFTYAENIGLRYGHLVIPFLANNFGPTYFCKLIRTK